MPTPKRLSSESHEAWFKKLAKLLPSKLVPRKPSPSTIAPNSCVSLDDFLCIIYKYADSNNLYVLVEKDLNRDDAYFLYLTGETQNPAVLPDRKVKRFQLSLNSAYVDGVQKEEIVNFRNTFFIADNDARFYQRDPDVPL
jgi:hypothetical protein